MHSAQQHRMHLLLAMLTKSLHESSLHHTPASHAAWTTFIAQPKANRGNIQGVASGSSTLAWLITGKSNVELAIFWQAESFSDSLGELLVACCAWLDLKGVCLSVKIDIHDSRCISTAYRGQGSFPVRECAVTEFTMRFLPAVQHSAVCYVHRVYVVLS